MRILFISYYGWNYGGGETYLFSLAKALQKNGHEVRILSSDYGKEFKSIESDYTFPVSKNLFINTVLRFYNPISQRALKKILQDYNPDVVHINSLSNLVTPSVTHILKEYPTVVSVHSMQMFQPTLPSKYKIHYYIPEVLYKWSRKNLTKNINKFTAPSRVVLNTIPTRFNDRSVIALGIDPLPFKKITNYYTVLYLGRVAKEKGIEVLLAAMPHILKQLPFVKLHVVGEGPELEKSHQFVHDKKISDNVTFSDSYVDPQTAKENLENATALVMPSTCQEAFGLSGIEALFIGRPVIASNIGGIPEWHKESFGSLVKPGDSKLLASTLINLLKDKDEIDNMSKAARSESKKYSIEKHSKEIEKLYSSVIHNRS